MKEKIFVTPPKPDNIEGELREGLLARKEVAKKLHQLLKRRHGSPSHVSQRFAVEGDPTSDLVVDYEFGMRKIRVAIPAPGEPGEPRMEDESKIQYDVLPDDVLEGYPDTAGVGAHDQSHMEVVDVQDLTEKEKSALRARVDTIKKINAILMQRHGRPTKRTQRFEHEGNPTSKVILEYSFGSREVKGVIPMYGQPEVQGSPE